MNFRDTVHLPQNYDQKKLDQINRTWPLTMKGNVKVVDGIWRIVLPDLELHVEKFIEARDAKRLLDSLNYEKRRKGGRPTTKPVGASIPVHAKEVFDE